MKKYVVTINVPGFLPEVEPVFFDVIEDAWYYIEDELKQDETIWWDSDYNNAEGSGAEQLEARDYAARNALGTVHYHGYAYSVDVAE